MALKQLASLAAATALVAASVTATPASADSDRLLKLALGIGALAIIADQARSNRAPAYNRTPVHSRQYRYEDRYYQYRDRDRYRRYDRSYDIPKTCLFKRWTRHGWQTFASRSCVDRYAARHHIRRADIQPCYRDHRGRIVWLDRRTGWGR